MPLVSFSSLTRKCLGSPLRIWTREARIPGTGSSIAASSVHVGAQTDEKYFRSTWIMDRGPVRLNSRFSASKLLSPTKAYPRDSDAGAFAESVGQVPVLQRRKLVEAAGIEPASESTPSGRPTCLARALCRPGADHGQPAPEPSPNGSRPAPSGRHAGPADFFGGSDRRHRLGSGIPRTSDRPRRRVRAQRCPWRLLPCPAF